MRGKFSPIQSLALLVSSLALTCPLYGQVAGATLSGTVSDQSGAIVPNAKVTIKNTATGLTRGIITDGAGVYSAPNLPAGRYDILVLASHFCASNSHGTQTAIRL